MRNGSAQSLGVHVFMSHGSDDAGAGDEHVARALDHDREVGDGGRIDCAACARAHDHRQLRHHSGCEGVAQEDVRVAAQRHDPLLDPRAARIVEADDRRADLHRKVHDLADLLGVRLGQGATEDREVLGEDEHQPAVDSPVASHNAVAEEHLFVEPEIRRAMRHQCVEFDEGGRVEEEVESLAGGELAARVLLFDSGGSPAEPGLLSHLHQASDPLLARRHGSPPN